MNTLGFGSAQRAKLQEVIREIKTPVRYSSLEDWDVGHPNRVRCLAIKLKMLAKPHLSAPIASRLRAIDAYAETVELEAELEAIVPMIEDALAHNDITPNPDLPEEIQRDFREAAAIYTRSPRGAAKSVAVRQVFRIWPSKRRGIFPHDRW